MQKIVSITSQGQLTIPQSFIRSLEMRIPTKAIIKKKGIIFEIRPQSDFWSLSSSLKSNNKLTDSQLRKARQQFSKTWAKQ